MHNVLVVDDEYGCFDVLKDAKIANMNFFYASNLVSMKKVLKNHSISLILMDWNLEDADGVDITKELKSEAQTKDIPIIMVSAQSITDKMVFALNQGADDYVVKPFTLEFLLAKINSNLRKYNFQGKPEQLNNICIDSGTYTITINSVAQILPQKEFQILCALIKNPEKTFSRDELNCLECPEYIVGTRTVDVLINRIRGKYEPQLGMRLIYTFYKKGYRINKDIFNNP
jgi:two-component system phosphate regulon response regulator PhoB